MATAADLKSRIVNAINAARAAQNPPKPALNVIEDYELTAFCQGIYDFLDNDIRVQPGITLNVSGAVTSGTGRLV